MKRIGKAVAITATVTLLVAVLLATCCQGSLQDALQATCRISGPQGVRGTGCAFERSQGCVYVLTNAHVASEANLACEFWQRGHKSRPLRAHLIRRTKPMPGPDAAILAIPESSFQGILPSVIPIAPRGTRLRAGQTICSVGCAKGSWQTAWQGHVLKDDGRGVYFRPTPAGGRSGSAIFDVKCEAIVGLLKACAVDNSYGLATSTGWLYEVLGTRKARSEIPQSVNGWRASRHEGYAVMPMPECAGGLFGGGCFGGRCPTPQQQPQQQPPAWPGLQGAPAVAPVADSAGLQAIAQGLGAMAEAQGRAADAQVKLAEAQAAYYKLQTSKAVQEQYGQTAETVAGELGPVLGQAVSGDFSGAGQTALQSDALSNALTDAAATALTPFLMTWGRLGILGVFAVKYGGRIVSKWVRGSVVQLWRDDNDTPDERLAKEKQTEAIAAATVKKINGGAPPAVPPK